MNIIRYLQGERRGMGSQFKTPNRAQRVTSLFASSILIPTLVLLADVSFWQDFIDFVKMKTAGMSGVIIRAGQRTWLDVKFSINWIAAKLAGLPRGSYWFYDSRETPEKQAALWWNQIKNDTGELFHVADLEESYGGAYGTKAHFKTFINEFQRLSGLPDSKIVIYTGFYWWQDRVGNDTFFSRFRLWLAWYSAMEVVRIPAPWTASSLILWQYTSSGDGLKYGVSSKEIDLNWYNGTPAQFAAEFGGSVSEPPTGGTMSFFQATGSQVIRTAGNNTAPLGVLGGTTQYILGPMSGSGSYGGDVVECEAPIGGYMKIKRLWRNGAWTQLPPAAYCSTNHLKSITFTPPADPANNDLSQLTVNGAVSLTIEGVSYTSGPVTLSKV